MQQNEQFCCNRYRLFSVHYGDNLCRQKRILEALLDGQSKPLFSCGCEREGERPCEYRVSQRGWLRVGV